MAPRIPAVLLETRFASVVLEITDMCENSIPPITTAARFPRPVTSGGSIVLETHRISIEQQYTVSRLRAGSPS
jgi:hypothetical protein